MLDGLIPVEADGKIFRLRGEPGNTEYIRFGPIVNGKCMRLKFPERIGDSFPLHEAREGSCSTHQD